MPTTRLKRLLPVLTAAALCLLAAAPAEGRMTSEKISKNVCLTTGGGKFVDIPGFPGERIDRRLLTDLKYLERTYKIFVTDGYSGDDVHAANGEHPIGLAADIVPDTAEGGTWADITRLANFAEPEQNQPISPFRWVGYNGDSGHGRGNHLHLSWNHSDTRPGIPAESVYTLRCPGSKVKGGGNTGGGNTGGGNNPPPEPTPTPSGGIKPGYGGSKGGGISAGRVSSIERELKRQAAHPVVETGGVGIAD